VASRSTQNVQLHDAKTARQQLPRAECKLAGKLESLSRAETRAIGVALTCPELGQSDRDQHERGADPTGPAPADARVVAGTRWGRTTPDAEEPPGRRTMRRMGQSRTWNRSDD